MEVYGDGKKVTRLILSEGDVPFLRGAQISEAAFAAYVLKRARDDKAGKIVDSMVVPTNPWRLNDDDIRAEAQRVARLAREAEICSQGSQEIEVLGRRLFEGEDAQIVYETYMMYGAQIAAEKSPPSGEAVTIQDSRGVDLDIADAFRGSVAHLAEPSAASRAPVPDRLSPPETVIDVPADDVGSVVDVLNAAVQGLRYDAEVAAASGASLESAQSIFGAATEGSNSSHVSDVHDALGQAMLHLETAQVALEDAAKAFGACARTIE